MKIQSKFTNMSRFITILLIFHFLLTIECDAASVASHSIRHTSQHGAGLDKAHTADSAAIETPSESMIIRKRRDLEGFGIQYWGENYNAKFLGATPHRALIIEASVRGADLGPQFREELFSAEDLSVIRCSGKRAVFAYLNLSELVAYRNYWVDAFGATGLPVEELASTGQASPAWYGGINKEGEHLAAFWTPEWLEILERQIDAFLERGFDGVFMDDVLHYYTWVHDMNLKPHEDSGSKEMPRSLPEFASAMMTLVLQITKYARHDAPLARSDFAVIVNGGVFIGWDAASESGAPEAPAPLFGEYVEALDAIAMESVLGVPTDWTTVEALQQSYAAGGVPVLSIDFHSRHPLVPLDEFRAQIAQLASTLGFISYVAENEAFDRLYPPILPETHLPATAQESCTRAGSAGGGFVP